MNTYRVWSEGGVEHEIKADYVDMVDGRLQFSVKQEACVYGKPVAVFYKWRHWIKQTDSQ